jgi:hypothetical protein
MRWRPSALAWVTLWIAALAIAGIGVVFYADLKSDKDRLEHTVGLLSADSANTQDQLRRLGVEPDAPPPEARTDAVNVPPVAPGPAGPVGPQGATGAPGQPGVPGPQGPTGPRGDDGTDGKDGAAGMPGATGPTGAKGATGEQGPAGADGAAGAPGPQGDPGPAGPQGPQGGQGPQGPPVGEFTIVVGPVTLRCADPEGDGAYTCERVA